MISTLVSTYFDRSWLRYTMKTNCMKLVAPEMLWFFEKGMGLVSPPQFPHDFSRKIFLIFYYINRPNFIAWLSLFPKILGNMCIAIVCFPVCDVISFEIYRNFLIKRFVFMTKKRQKDILSSNKKLFFITFRRLSVARNCLRFESVLLREKVAKTWRFWIYWDISKFKKIIESFEKHVFRSVKYFCLLITKRSHLPVFGWR